MQNLNSKFALENYCKSVVALFDTIPEKRKELLKRLSKYIVEKAQRQADIKLVVICTHNSRRSHIGQLWLQSIIDYLVDECCEGKGCIEVSGGKNRKVQLK